MIDKTNHTYELSRVRKYNLFIFRSHDKRAYSRDKLIRDDITHERAIHEPTRRWSRKIDKISLSFNKSPTVLATQELIMSNAFTGK